MIHRLKSRITEARMSYAKGFVFSFFALAASSLEAFPTWEKTADDTSSLLSNSQIDIEHQLWRQKRQSQTSDINPTQLLSLKARIGSFHEKVSGKAQECFLAYVETCPLLDAWQQRVMQFDKQAEEVRNE